MWIDPLEVSYRIGENGSSCVLDEYKEGSAINEPWKPNNVKTSSSSSTTTSTTNNANNSNNKNESTKIQNNQQQQQQQQQSALDNNCKDTLRKMDYLLDPRKSVSIEQLAAFVSSSQTQAVVKGQRPRGKPGSQAVHVQA